MFGSGQQQPLGSTTPAFGAGSSAQGTSAPLFGSAGTYTGRRSDANAQRCDVTNSAVHRPALVRVRSSNAVVVNASNGRLRKRCGHNDNNRWVWRVWCFTAIDDARVRIVVNDATSDDHRFRWVRRNGDAIWSVSDNTDIYRIWRVWNVDASASASPRSSVWRVRLHVRPADLRCNDHAVSGAILDSSPTIVRFRCRNAGDNDIGVVSVHVWVVINTGGRNVIYDSARTVWRDVGRSSRHDRRVDIARFRRSSSTDNPNETVRVRRHGCEDDARTKFRCNDDTVHFFPVRCDEHHACCPFYPCCSFVRCGPRNDECPVVHRVYLRRHHSDACGSCRPSGTVVWRGWYDFVHDGRWRSKFRYRLYCTA